MRTLKYLLLLLAVAVNVQAQGLRIKQSKPDCDITRKAYDNPFSDHWGYTQPRYAWHAEYAAGALALGYGLHKIAPRVPAWVDAAIVTVGMGLVPHIRGGLIKRTYPINPLDWTFDLWDRATPAFWAVAHKDDKPGEISWSSHAKASGEWLLGYAALACFASP